MKMDVFHPYAGLVVAAITIICGWYFKLNNLLIVGACWFVLVCIGLIVFGTGPKD